MKNILVKIFVIYISLSYNPVAAQSAYDIPRSGEQRSSFASIAAVGYDNATSRISGFFHLKQVQGVDHSFHADCTIVFSGYLERTGEAHVFATDATAKKSKFVKGILEFRGYARITPNTSPEEIFSLQLSENLTSCSAAVDVSESTIDFEINKFDKWKMVSAVRSKRAYFYDEPDEAARRNVFLVAGDVIYIYDDNSDWYFVKYKDPKKETMGWVKKSATIQVPIGR